MRARAISALGLATVLAASACGLIAGLEPPLDDTTAPIEGGAGDTLIPADSRPNGWCAMRTGDLYCNDFDDDAKTFGFEEQAKIAGTVTLDRDPYAKSEPSSLAVHVAPSGSAKPLFYLSQRLEIPNERLRLMMDVSFGAKGDDVDATVSPVTLAFVGFESQKAIAFGVIKNEFIVAFLDNFIDIQVSAIAARGYKLGGSLPVGYDYTHLDFRIARFDGAPPCEANSTQYVGPEDDAAIPASSLYVVAYLGNETPLRCARLPEIVTGTKWTLLVGGFLKEALVPYEWRFDNVAVRLD